MCFFTVLPVDVIRRGEIAGSLSPHAFALQKAAGKKRAIPCRLIKQWTCATALRHMVFFDVSQTGLLFSFFCSVTHGVMLRYGQARQCEQTEYCGRR
ncbi:hypothetical protein V8C44DRAFT_331506 [Trichoderma aethiopicum]